MITLARVKENPNFQQAEFKQGFVTWPLLTHGSFQASGDGHCNKVCITSCVSAHGRYMTTSVCLMANNESRCPQEAVCSETYPPWRIALSHCASVANAERRFWLALPFWLTLVCRFGNMFLTAAINRLCCDIFSSLCILCNILCNKNNSCILWQPKHRNAHETKKWHQNLWHEARNYVSAAVRCISIPAVCSNVSVCMCVCENCTSEPWKDAWRYPPAISTTS